MVKLILICSLVVAIGDSGTAVAGGDLDPPDPCCLENGGLRVVVGALSSLGDCAGVPRGADYGSVFASSLGDYRGCFNGPFILEQRASSFGPEDRRLIEAWADTWNYEPWPRGLHASARASIFPGTTGVVEDPEINLRMARGHAFMLKVEQAVGSYRAECESPCGFGTASSGGGFVLVSEQSCPVVLRVVGARFSELCGLIGGETEGFSRDSGLVITFQSGAHAQTAVFGSGRRNGALLTNVPPSVFPMPGHVSEYVPPIGIPTSVGFAQFSFSPAELDLNGNGVIDLIDLDIVESRFTGLVGPNPGWASLFSGGVVTSSVLDQLKLLIGSGAVAGLYPARPCSVADIADTDGVLWPDGMIDSGDFVAFFDAFFASQLVADIVNADGAPLPLFGGFNGGGPDGAVDSADFSAFFDAFFLGC